MVRKKDKLIPFGYSFLFDEPERLKIVGEPLLHQWAMNQPGSWHRLCDGWETALDGGYLGERVGELPEGATYCRDCVSVSVRAALSENCPNWTAALFPIDMSIGGTPSFDGGSTSTR